MTMFAPAPASAPAPAPADQTLADGFARHVEAWALAVAADASSARAARHAASALSLATSSGHVCTLLTELSALPGGPADAAAWRQALLASGVVGRAEQPGVLPMVLDSDDRLYLHRYFDHEQRLARRLVRAAGAAALPTGDLTLLQSRLSELFAANAAGDSDKDSDGDNSGADWQKLAAALALRSRLCIISGGPGTGKTTTVVNLLACLIEMNPDCRIALAAPTGKAAARLTEALRQRAAHLPDTIRQRLPAESFTVHRLLGVTPQGGGFVHHAGNPLAIDALVVDEASMLDLALATRLLEAVPATAHIVLLGDKDQLSAVESGAVFSELSLDPSLSAACVLDLARLTGTPAEQIRPPAPLASSALHDSVVWFTQNFRFAGDSGIGQLAALINRGDAPRALACLRAGTDASLRWLDDSATAPTPATLQHIVAGHAGFVAMVATVATVADVSQVSAAFARFRVLCAVREGPRGVVAINAEMTRRVRSAGAHPASANASPWYAGRPVLVLRNDALLKLFNGDIGITLPDASGRLMVYFPEPDGGFRAVAPVRLPPHETAYAMTVHKSQGSEFDQVLVLLPSERSRVLTRELLYTAVTRARQQVTVCGGEAVLTNAITTTTQRRSGLLARLRECVDQPLATIKP